jgi:hypothetical protein
MTVNHWVAGSSPARGAKEYKASEFHALRLFCFSVTQV